MCERNLRRRKSEDVLIESGLSVPVPDRAASDCVHQLMMVPVGVHSDWEMPTQTPFAGHCIIHLPGGNKGKISVVGFFLNFCFLSNTEDDQLCYFGSSELRNF